MMRTLSVRRSARGLSGHSWCVGAVDAEDSPHLESLERPLAAGDTLGPPDETERERITRLTIDLSAAALVSLDRRGPRGAGSASGADAAAPAAEGSGPAAVASDDRAVATSRL